MIVEKDSLEEGGGMKRRRDIRHLRSSCNPNPRGECPYYCVIVCELSIHAAGHFWVELFDLFMEPV